MSFVYDHADRKHTLDGFPIPSVTQILKGGYPKGEGIMNWVAEETAKEAFDLREALPKMPREQTIDLLKGARWRRLDKASSRGTAVHDAISAHFAGDDPSEGLTDQQWGYFNAALSFFDERKVEAVDSEFSVYSRENLYCGRADLLGRRAGGELELFDFKTKDLSEKTPEQRKNARLYAEVVLQLTAYSRAESVSREDADDEPMPHVRKGVGVLLNEAGRYRAWPIDLTDEAFDAFLATRVLYEFDRAGYRRAFGRLLKAA